MPHINNKQLGASGLIFERLADREYKKFCLHVKDLDEKKIVEYVRSHGVGFLKPGEAIKIKKIRPDLNQEIDRSNVLQKSLMILSNQVVFRTGKNIENDHLSAPLNQSGKQVILGKGGTKTVHLAYDLNHERDLAVASTSDLIFKFIYESRMTQNIDSEHVLQAQCYVRIQTKDHRKAYLISEVCKGTLNPTIFRKHPEFMGQIRQAFNDCHRANIAHKDAGPENIFIANGKDGRLIIKLADFDLARNLSSMGEAQKEEFLHIDEGFLDYYETEYGLSRS